MAVLLSVISQYFCSLNVYHILICDSPILSLLLSLYSDSLLSDDSLSVQRHEWEFKEKAERSHKGVPGLLCYTLQWVSWADITFSTSCGFPVSFLWLRYVGRLRNLPQKDSRSTTINRRTHFMQFFFSCLSQFSW